MAIVTTKRREQQIERPAQRSATLQRYQHTAGALLASAGAIALMAIITAEALYPAAYDTSTSTISDLGATLPPNSVILQPSATIFDVAMVVIGLMIVAGAAFLQRALGRKTLSIALGLFGLGALGVGVFPGNHLAPHQLFAMLAFISGGVAALVAARVLTAPVRQLSVVLGAASLVSFFLAMFMLEWGPIAELGEGGIERWIVYPVILWLTMFGGALMAHAGAAGTTTTAHGGG